MTQTITAVILAHRHSDHFLLKSKLTTPSKVMSVMDRLLETLNTFFSRILLVAPAVFPFLENDIEVVTPLMNRPEPIGSMAAIHAGLFYAASPYAFFCRLDRPFLNPDLVQHLCACCHEGLDFILPQTPFGWEPLCAVYSQRCLESLEHHLNSNRLSIMRALKKRPTRIISKEKLRQLDPQMRSFVNVYGLNYVK